MPSDIPIVKIARYGNVLGVRGPNSEPHAGHTICASEVCTQSFVCLLERAFAVEVQVEIGELWTEAVGIFELGLASIPEANADPVVAGITVYHGSEESGIVPFRHGAAPASINHFRRFCLRQEDAHYPASMAVLFAHAVGTEDSKCIAVISTYDCFYLCWGHESLIASMDDFLRNLPKAELHLHLEGSVEPETLHELDPTASLEECRAIYCYPDFDAFLKAFGAVGKRLRTPADYALVTRRLLERLEAQNVRYAEITLAVGVVLWKGQELAPIFEAVREAAAGSPVVVRWIFDAVRQFGAGPAMRVAELAAERVNQDVVAYGIGGSEERGPAAWFTDVFAFARRSGLRLTAHAGESVGPESVWAALELGAERIGHGIAAVRDPALMCHLRERDVPLEVCITSNLVTGVVKRLEEHPVRQLYEAGVPVILNSDDPAMFGCTLVGEFELAARAFGFTDAELRGIAENGFRYAFDTPKQK